jgi:hypothetical protein
VWGRPVGGGGAHHPPPGGRRGGRQALGDCRQAVPAARRLAAEDERSAGAKDSAELREGAIEVGQVVEHRMPEHEVEARLVEGELARLGTPGLDRQPKGLGALREAIQHPL